MNQKLALRLVLGLFLLAALVLAFNWFRSFMVDPDTGTLDSAGYIAAIQRDGASSVAVVIKPDGTTLKPPSSETSRFTDREIAWGPDGNRIFFSSNRKQRAFNIYRWNLAKNSLEQRSVGRRSQGNVAFSKTARDNTTAWITSGGYVLEFSPRTAETRQVLPPTTSEIATEQGEGEQGSTGQFEAQYKRIGESFIRAVPVMDGKGIVALMKRETGEEALVFQDLRPVSGSAGRSALRPPQIVGVGDRIGFDVSSKAILVLAIEGFGIPDPAMAPKEWIKNGRVVMPYRNLLAFIDLEKPESGLQPVLTLPNDATVLRDPRISPNGEFIAVVAGTKDKEGSFEAKNIVLFPAAANSVSNAVPLVGGNIRGVSWHPDSRGLLFIREDSGQDAIWRIRVDGTGEERITKEGNFDTPLYSPQTK